MVQGVEGVDGSGAAHGDHGGAHLAAEHASVGLRNQAGAVHQRLDFGSDVGDIGGGAEQDAVGLFHLLDVGVAHVIALGALVVLLLRAFAAGETAVDFGSAHLDEFGFNPFLFKLLQHIAKQNGGIAALASATVERNHPGWSSIHRIFPFETPSWSCSEPALAFVLHCALLGRSMARGDDLG